MKPIRPLFAAALVLILTVSAQAQPKVTEGVLTDPAGMSLYWFDGDVPGSGKSTCNGPCAANWPPLLAKADTAATGDYSIITRDDGQKQWAYKNRPLYRWINDKKPGETTGDGYRGGMWHLAMP